MEPNKQKKEEIIEDTRRIINRNEELTTERQVQAENFEMRLQDRLRKSRQVLDNMNYRNIPRPYLRYIDESRQIFHALGRAQKLVCNRQAMMRINEKANRQGSRIINPNSQRNQRERNQQRQPRQRQLSIQESMLYRRQVQPQPNILFGGNNQRPESFLNDNGNVVNEIHPNPIQANEAVNNDNRQPDRNQRNQIGQREAQENQREDHLPQVNIVNDLLPQNISIMAEQNLEPKAQAEVGEQRPQGIREKNGRQGIVQDPNAIYQDYDVTNDDNPYRRYMSKVFPDQFYNYSTYPLNQVTIFEIVIPPQAHFLKHQGRPFNDIGLFTSCNWNKLWCLNLISCRINDDIFGRLVDGAASYPNVVALQLSYNQIRNVTQGMLERFNRSNRLQYINFGQAPQSNPNLTHQSFIELRNYSNQHLGCRVIHREYDIELNQRRLRMNIDSD